MREEDMRRAFWDSADQRKKAAYYATRKGFNLDNIEQKQFVRKVFREKEGRDIKTGEYTLPTLLNLEKKYNEGILKRPSDKVSATKAELVQYQKDQERVKAYFAEKKRRKTQVLPEPVTPTYKGQPTPTGYISDLNLGDWMLKYTPSLFGAANRLIRLKDEDKAEIEKELLEKGYTEEMTLEIFKTTNKHNYVRKVSFYKSQDFILKMLETDSWVMIKIFRSAGKTQITAGLLAYYICQNPDGKYFYCCEELKKANSRVNMVRTLLTSDIIVADYGYLINDSSGNKKKVKGKDIQGEFICHRNIISIEPTLQAITPESARALGQHYTGGVIDDPWSVKKEAEKGAKEKWMNWWREFCGSLEKCDFLFMVCTRKGTEDIYQTLSDDGDFADITQPLVEYADWEKCTLLKNKKGQYIGAEWEMNEDGTPPYKLYDDCKGKYSMSVEFKPTWRQKRKGMTKITCIPIKRHQDRLYFEMEYQQNPYLPEGEVFKWDNVTVFDNTTDDPFIQHYLKATSGKRRIKIMDMALGESAKADDNCLMVLCRFKNRYFVEKLYIGKWSIQKRKEIIKQADREYPGVPIYIESDLWQLSIINDLRKALSKSFKIREFKSREKGQNYQGFYKDLAARDKSMDSRKVAKMGKIHDALKEPWDAGNIYFYKDAFIYKDKRRIKNYLDKFRQEIIQFPKCKWWDALDTLAMGVLVLKSKKGGVIGF